uniref:Uncharacterized protein n=1 Tax=Aegilops tauschii subsp. strangulata TaxID=200361 RepID=A0A453P8N5_AEGTS
LESRALCNCQTHPRGEEARCAEQEAKKMAAALDGVSSCGSINMRRVDHLLPLPLPCVGESTAASRVSLGSSPARSDASEGAASFYAE